MVQKNFGPAVSGYLDPSGRSFEQTVYQSGKPLLDKELNLSSDVSNAFGLELARKLSSSGWLTKSPLSSSYPLDGIFNVSATANMLSLGNDLVALVNGWVVPVQYTGSNTSNDIQLSAGPSGNGAKRTDLVVLEVWRKLLSPSPSTDGKSTGARIWRNGNVKVPSAFDASLNYADDLLDGTVGSETTKRVQIQYRLRVVDGVDLFSYPMGMDDPVVVANSVPASALLPDGSATAFAYSNQSANGDGGLWRAGDGNPANSLGTVDGYMYAIPLVGVFRRNTSAFDRNANHNGGVASPGPSDRPDGLFHDIFVVQDLADLRMASSLTGWENFSEIGEKNFSYLLDNTLRTEWATTNVGGGVSGHTVMYADEIGVLPGDGVLTGDTPGAEFIGQFDCTRRFFSDRAVYEVMTYQIAPGDPNVSTATWQNGTVITINPTSISQYPFSGAIGFISRAPSGTRIVDLLRARIEGTTALQKALDVGSASVSASATIVPVASVTGLGSYPPGNIIVTLGTLPIGGMTTEPIYFDLLIAYPSGAGLTKTATDDYGSASFTINNPGALPATAPVNYSALANTAIDPVHREAQLQYATTTLTYTFTADSSVSVTQAYLPERADSLVQVRINSIPYGGVATLDTSGRLVSLSGGPSMVAGDVVDVDYVALRPMPQSGVQMTLYYETRASQTVRSSIVGTSVTMVPRWVSPFLYTLTAGSGSQYEAYPYPVGYVQTGGIKKASGSFSGEHELNGEVDVYIAEFNAATGFLKLPTIIPYVPAPEAVTFTRNVSDTDIEDRVFFPGVPAGYQPNAFGQVLSNDQVHKTVLPTLMELSADGTLGPKGTLYLVLLTRWAAFDSENSVKFLTSGNSTVASVFRVSGNLLNRGS